MKRLIGLAVLLVSVFIFATLAEAATASWQANTEADLAGYNIYRALGTCATPGAFAKVDTATKTEVSAVLDNPVADGKYCHRMTAFDTANNESVFSNTAEFDYNVVPPKAPALFTVK